MANVRIPDVDLVFEGGDGTDGFYIRTQGLSGLLDGVDVLRDSVPRPGSDGVFPGTSRLAPRVVALGGPCIADSAAELDHRSSRLKSLQRIRDEFRVVFDMPGKTVWAMGHVSDRPSFDVTLWGQRAEWDLELQFDDPRLFGTARGFPGASGSDVWVHHYGNFDASPKLTVVGSIGTGYTVWGPDGKKYTVTTPVVAGAPHTIDMHTGTLRVNGAVVHGSVSQADTWGAPAGTRVNYRLVPVSGAGTLTVETQDTFI